MDDQTRYERAVKLYNRSVEVRSDHSIRIKLLKCIVSILPLNIDYRVAYNHYSDLIKDYASLGRFIDAYDTCVNLYSYICEKDTTVPELQVLLDTVTFLGVITDRPQTLPIMASMKTTLNPNAIQEFHVSHGCINVFMISHIAEGLNLLGDIVWIVWHSYPSIDYDR